MNLPAHGFEGMNRICSKLGGGFDAGLLVEIEDTVPALACDYVQQSKRQNEGVNRTFADCLGMGAEVDGKYDLYKVVIRETERDEKEPAFYYHSDHLGSAAYLTNDDGKVTQTLNYLPYGEDWVDVRNDFDPRLGQYTFNGKEKDYESGFHYYGARYYWSELLTGWLSVDPMADKYPSISPYNYCMWNPVRLIDPDGNFPVSLHKKMVEKALGSRSVGSNVRRGLLCGTGVYSDWFHASNSSFHMDNMKGTESIKMLYNEHMKGFSDNMDKGDYVAAGADLHAIADFYSHSNYVDLYQQYFESRGEAVSVTSIKPFSEMMKNQDFMDFVGGQGGLKTGTFSIKGWFTEFFLGKAPEQGSHSLMNMDYGENPKKSPHGIESFGLGGTKHQAASEAAQKEINKLIEAKLPQ